MRWKIIKEILWKPVWGVVLFVVATVGNIEPIVNILEFIIGKEIPIENSMDSRIMVLFSMYWFPFLLVIFSITVAEGIYRKARFYLGDSIVSPKISFDPKDEYSLSEEWYAWVSVENNENLDLEDCYADFKRVVVKLNDKWLDITESINETLSELTWPDFEEHKGVVVRRKRKARLNIAKTKGDDITYIFDRGDNVTGGSKKIYVEVAVNGLIQGKPIEEAVFRGFLELEPRFSSSQEVNKDGPFSISHRLLLEPGVLEEKPIFPKREGL